MDNNLKNARYVEPGDYIPKEIRKKLKMGEFAETAKDKKKAAVKRNAPKKK